MQSCPSGSPSYSVNLQIIQGALQVKTPKPPTCAVLHISLGFK
jgi:hypothetical protein